MPLNVGRILFPHLQVRAIAHHVRTNPCSKDVCVLLSSKESIAAKIPRVRIARSAMHCINSKTEIKTPACANSTDVSPRECDKEKSCLQGK